MVCKNKAFEMFSFFNEKILICKSLKSCSARHVCTFWNNAYFRVCRAPCSRRSFTCQLGETLGKASETRVTEFVIENRPKNSYFGQKQRNFFSNSACYGGGGRGVALTWKMCKVRNIRGSEHLINFFLSIIHLKKNINKMFCAEEQIARI